MSCQPSVQNAPGGVTFTEVTHACQGSYGIILTRGLAGGFGEREQQGEEGELPVVGKDEDREGFVYFQGSPRISQMLL